MTNSEDLNRRLTIAIAEAKDADRIWRLATAVQERIGTDEDHTARRRLDALWQERERAHHRVVELRWLAATRRRRPPVAAGQRLRSARQTLALMGYRATGGTL